MNPTNPRAIKPTEIVCMETSGTQISATLADKADAANVNMLCEKIKRSWAGMVDSIVETGRLLSELRNSTEHGAWASVVADRLPFNEETATKLIRIAQHPILSNPSRATDLPAKWTLLAEMTYLDETQLEEGISEGIINPKMKRDALRNLTRRLRGAVSIEPVTTHAVAPPTPDVDDLLHADRVINCIAGICGVTVNDIKAETRFSRPASFARHVVAYVLMTNNGWTSTRVATTLVRDRTTIEHSRNLIAELRDDEACDFWVESICVLLTQMQKLADGQPEKVIERSKAA